MNGIADIRQMGARVTLAFLLVNIPIVGVVAWSVGNGVLAPTVMAAVAAAVATIHWYLAGDNAGVRATLGVAAMAMPALIVFGLTGHPWQIDGHMYFFASLAILTVLCDWRAILTAAGTVAVHHLVLNYALPMAVFPEGTSLLRVILHAVIVVVEAATLVWLAWRLSASFEASETALATASANSAVASLPLFETACWTALATSASS